MDTKERAKRAAAARWAKERTNKQSSTIRIPEDLANLLKASAEERQAAVGDYLREIMRQTSEVVERIDAIQTTDPNVIKAFDAIRKAAEYAKKWKQYCAE